MGMGGAFIAVADDATAASWNPGGLIQLERPEMSIVYSYYARQESYSSESHPEAETSNSMDSGNLNYLSVAYPFAIKNTNFVFSLNYQHLYDFTKDIEFNYNFILSAGTLYDHINFKQRGGLWTISPALAVQVTPRFSLGATFNIWENVFGDNSWESRYRSSPTGTLSGFPVIIQIRSVEKFDFSGYNAHFGFLWDMSEKFTLGGVYKTGFKAKIKRDSSFFESQTFPTFPAANTVSLTETLEYLRLRMPESYGVGLAVRFSDSFTLALDVYRTEWGKFVLIDSSGNETSPVTGMSKDQSKVKATHQVRVGAEYLLILEKTIIPIRAGIFYDPEPSRENPEDFYGFSMGTGFMWKNLVIDAAYQYRWGSGVGGDVIGVPNTSADINQHLALVSAIYHF